MTEGEWSGCADPAAMLRFLKFKLGVRKVRLFAAACQRREWDRLGVEARAAVEEAERLADDRPAIEALGLRAAKADADAARHAAGYAVGTTDSDRDAQVALLRCIFGPLPFRAMEVPLSWRTSLVRALATAIYEDRRWDDMPILGDALAEAGCDNAEMLEHCHGPGPHTRGCWLVDLLLKKG